IAGMPAPPEPAFVKGHYFSLSGRAPFRRLIYPAPRDGGLGIHLTLDLAGRARFGPDTQWLDTRDPTALDYGNDGTRGDAFQEAIRTYWPGLPSGALVPDYTGVRPKVAGAAYPDFTIAAHGRHIALYGIESPGLTACLAIGELVRDLVLDAPQLGRDCGNAGRNIAPQH
ncbi:MAG: FAD-dependent oxidoreductase, partial [Pseudomonadota bacterium]